LHLLILLAKDNLRLNSRFENSKKTGQDIRARAAPTTDEIALGAIF
jgi:hypothetical protein